MTQKVSLQILRADKVKPEVVSWIRPKYLPQGKVVVLVGPPGIGKSTLTLDTVARISRGTPAADRLRAGEALCSAQQDSGLGIPVESISLMRSILRPEDATYQRVARMPLAGDRASGQLR